jgi:hypothetical protein
MRVKIAQSGAVKKISAIRPKVVPTIQRRLGVVRLSLRPRSSAGILFVDNAKPKLRGLLKLHRWKAQRFACGEKREDRPLVPFMADGIINH